MEIVAGGRCCGCGCGMASASPHPDRACGEARESESDPSLESGDEYGEESDFESPENRQSMSDCQIHCAC